MHVSCIKSSENEDSGQAEDTSFCSVYFMDSNEKKEKKGGKRRKKIEKEFHRNSLLNIRNKYWNTGTGRLASNSMPDFVDRNNESRS